MRDQAVWMRILAAGALLTLSVLVATLLATTARVFWLGDLAVHFPVQYAGLALLGFLLFLIARRPGWAALALALAVFNVMNAAPGLATHPPVLPKPVAGAATDSMKVRVASINVFYRNRDYARVAAFIHGAKPDAVVLVEMNADWRRALARVQGEFPYRYQTRGAGGRGVDLWSRLPLIALGDFNITPYSPHFRQLLVDGNLRSAAEGFGWQPTWPTFLPPAGIQIDHAFVSPKVAVQGFRRGASDGSDHRPIVIDLVL